MAAECIMALFEQKDSEAALIRGLTGAILLWRQMQKTHDMLEAFLKALGSADRG